MHAGRNGSLQTVSLATNSSSRNSCTSAFWTYGTYRITTDFDHNG
jgi:hypothetical protein